MKILCVIPTLRDDPSDTLDSLKRQILPPAKIVVATGSRELSDKISGWNDPVVSSTYVRPDLEKSVGERICEALNSALQSVNPIEFDHFLRVDADITLPPMFTKENLPFDKVVFHGDGSTFFISMKSFLKIFNGSFPVVNAEDAYVINKYEMNGYAIKDWIVKPTVVRTSSKHNSWKYFYNEGFWRYRLGYEFVHNSFGELRYLLIDRNPLELFEIVGFLSAWFRNVDKLDVADFIWRKRANFSSKKLIRLLKSRRH